MAIDKPLDQAEVILANEQRQSSTVTAPLKRAVSFLAASAGAIASLKSGCISEAITNLAESIQSISEAKGAENAEYLLSIVVSEIRFLADRFDQLDKTQQDFLNGDWLGLLVDADRKARQTRTREKVERLAKVLYSAATITPPPPGDEVEEMLRIAMFLDDRDVIVLREAARLQGSLIKTSGKPTQYEAMTKWREGHWPDLRISEGELDSVCGKLQSFGLMVRLDQPNTTNVMAVVLNDYILLMRGLRFVEYIREVHGQE